MNFPSITQEQNQPNSSPFTNFSSFLHNITTNLSTHLNTHLPNFVSPNPLFARIPSLNENSNKITTIAKKINNDDNRRKNGGVSMSNEVIEERLAGVPVYALSNSNEEFVLISGAKTKKSLGLFCFKKEDADSLLDQMKLLDPNMRRGSRVVPVALNKVFQLKVNGVAFRLIPEASQIKNALREKEKAGASDEEFLGVPVFQSRSLTLKANNRTYRPVFFRKEDLENSLLRASRQQRRLNPVFRQGDVEVAVLEEIIKGMKDLSCSKWDDIVFIPPGFDVSTDPSENHDTAA